MRIIKLNIPRKLVFGDNCFQDFIEYFNSLSYKKVFVIADPNVVSKLTTLFRSFDNSGIQYLLNAEITKEPTVEEFNKILKDSEHNEVDAVVGIGGGSVLDVAKLVAALSYSGEKVESVFGIGNIKHRKLYLACLPTTAGTGSEMSPNSILLDENDKLKKGIVSPFLVPDATFVDPVFTYTVPASVTAATGIDALTHCIEAYANKFAHPIIDLYALEGIRLIYGNLEKAYIKPLDTAARAKIALGSMYGGMCLGPVNTAAVHALAYPLGGEYHIPHGVSNALLLPHVLEMNLPYGVERYAEIAVAIGAEEKPTNFETAKEGINRIAKLCEKVRIPNKLTEFNVPERAVHDLSKSALTVQRLLKNNLRDLTREDIERIYYRLF